MTVITNPNLETLRTGSYQDILDTAYAFLIAQGKPSVNAAGLCLYRGPNSLKCALGFFISDEEYKPEMECGTVCSPYASAVVVTNDAHRETFLRALQSVHDKFADQPLHAWLSELNPQIRKLAQDFNLKSPV